MGRRLCRAGQLAGWPYRQAAMPTGWWPTARPTTRTDGPLCAKHHRMRPDAAETRIRGNQAVSGAERLSAALSPSREHSYAVRPDGGACRQLRIHLPVHNATPPNLYPYPIAISKLIAIESLKTHIALPGRAGELGQPRQRTPQICYTPVDAPDAPLAAPPVAGTDTKV